MAVEHNLEQRDAGAVFPGPDIEHGRKSSFALGCLAGCVPWTRSDVVVSNRIINRSALVGWVWNDGGHRHQLG
jgi:hypothetical protein